VSANPLGAIPGTFHASVPDDASSASEKRKANSRRKSKPKAKVEHLDESDVATILAALRLFQREYEDCESVQIADAEVAPQPLASEDIDTLCERINCAKVLSLPE
jgi:hypothetical protein